MKRFSWTMVVALLCLTPAIAEHDEQKSWLDLESCEVCRCMGEHMDVMQDVTWESHKIDNGLLSVSVIPNKHRKLLDRLHENMKAVAAKLDDGKKHQLCGHCDSYEQLKKEGAKLQEISTDFGMISMLTSSDPEIVKKIHAHTDRTTKEFEAMTKAMTNQQ